MAARIDVVRNEKGGSLCCVIQRRLPAMVLLENSVKVMPSFL